MEYPQGDPMNSLKTCMIIMLLFLAGRCTLLQGKVKPAVKWAQPQPGVKTYPSEDSKMQAAFESAAPAQNAASDKSSQPELKAAKIDFVPGEKTIFFDDFSDMAADEPPPHWKV